MAKAPIKVPKTPTKAFNPHRKPSKLLLDQVKHLEWAVLPAAQRKPYDLPRALPKTEAQAAERIGQLTALLAEIHEVKKRAPGHPLVTAKAVTLPPLPKAPKPAAASKILVLKTPGKPKTARKRTKR